MGTRIHPFRQHTTSLGQHLDSTWTTPYETHLEHAFGTHIWQILFSLYLLKYYPPDRLVSAPKGVLIPMLAPKNIN
ncbi:hypothetical protein Glove_395g14 [Diversispora epigaea]|uniref:Uncharacterized protein n=1 Tax=Diversispora epigaea TaxID=1348612 RepID=A0A397H999_9GLOM|nr:hypothetical protein Glove_395g14 [Diversispora epigaea]